MPDAAGRQAKLLGYPDATVIATPFGVFVADNIQMVQFVLITNCRDESSTRHGLQRFFDWLEQSGEENYVACRAEARAAIVRVIADYINTISPSKQITPSSAGTGQSAGVPSSTS